MRRWSRAFQMLFDAPSCEEQKNSRKLDIIIRSESQCPYHSEEGQV